MRIIITGATGSIGTELVRQCLLSPSISHITILARRPLPESKLENSDKLHFIKHTDFLQYPPSLLDELRSLGITGCIWCLGISTGRAENRKQYELINKEFPIAAAKAFKSLSPDFRFIYTSAPGADPSAWLMLPQVRGQTEVALLAEEGIDVFMVRPGVVEAKKENANFLERFAAFTTPAFRIVTPGFHIHGYVIARGYIKVATQGMEGVKTVLGEETRILSNKQMKLLGQALE